MVREHGGRVLVGNGRLSDHHLLVLDEVVLTSVTARVMSMVQAIRVVPAVCLDLAGVLLRTHRDHAAVGLSIVVHLRVLLTLRRAWRALRVADEHDIALVDGSVVRAAVRSLLVAPAEAGAAAIVGRAQADREAAQVLRVLPEVEQ